MASALELLSVSLDEVDQCSQFVGVAALLRPRLGKIIDWSKTGDQPELLDIARSFMDIKGLRREIMYGALLVRILASFERFIRQLVEEALRVQVVGKPFADLSDVLLTQHLQLTGRVLASKSEPRDYQTFDYAVLVANLATCRLGSTAVSLNSSVFSAVVTGSAPAIIERALKNVNIDEWWDDVAKDPSLRKLLGSKKPRETANLARDRLAALTRTRNILAHAGDEPVEVSEIQFRESMDFVRFFAAALSSVVMRQASN